MIDIRRVFTHVEHIHHEFGPRAATPLVRGAIGAVLTNPFAGRYEPDILPMMALLDPVGVDMAHTPARRHGRAARADRHLRQGRHRRRRRRAGARRAVARARRLRDARAARLEGRPRCLPQGTGRRKTGQPGNALSIVPSTKKVGPPGAALDVPLTNINASYVRGQFDAIEVRVPARRRPTRSSSSSP